MTSVAISTATDSHETSRIDTHTQHQNKQRRKYELLAPAEVGHAAQILARDRAEDHPAVQIEHVHRAEEQRRRREEAFERRNPESSEQDQKFADKPAGTR